VEKKKTKNVRNGRKNSTEGNDSPFIWERLIRPLAQSHQRSLRQKAKCFHDKFREQGRLFGESISGSIETGREGNEKKKKGKKPSIRREQGAKEKEKRVSWKKVVF